MFVKCETHFDVSKQCGISNFYDETTYHKYFSDNIYTRLEDGTIKLPHFRSWGNISTTESSPKEDAQPKSTTTDHLLPPCVLPHKVIIKDITKLTTDNINFTGLVKNDSIS